VGTGQDLVAGTGWILDMGVCGGQSHRDGRRRCLEAHEPMKNSWGARAQANANYWTWKQYADRQKQSNKKAHDKKMSQLRPLMLAKAKRLGLAAKMALKKKESP
jgi:hypothetical protein